LVAARRAIVVLITSSSESCVNTYRSVRRPMLACTVMLLGVVLNGCRRAAAGEAEARPEATVAGTRLELPPGSPHIASLSATPVHLDSAQTIWLNGRLSWDEDVTVRVFSPFAGRVARVLADQGRTVQAGQTLATIAAPDFGQAQADARRADTDLELARRTLARQRDLLDHGLVARKDVEVAEADVARAAAEHERALARLTLYGRGGDTLVDQLFPLRAPIGGQIVDRSITPGQEVRPDQMLANAPQLFAPLYVITDPARLWVMLDVPEQELDLLHEGQPVTIRAQAWPRRTFRGQLTLVAGAIDPNTRTLKVRGTLDNSDGALKGEMLVTVGLADRVGASSTIAVPSSAVLLVGEQHVVYVELARGRYERRAIQVGIAHDGVVPVVTGLSAGERVVTGSTLLLEQLFQSTARS
jgi:cobalt-zinc-cadmium efflux system membrane fusion protein